MNNPHDKLFKTLFGRPENAIPFLRNNLPSALLDEVELEQLEIEKNHFIGPDNVERESDMVYRLRRKSDGSASYVYLLMEHQSTYDVAMVPRLLQYNALLLLAFLKKNKGAKLPPVYNLLFFTGVRKYKGPRTLAEAFFSPQDWQRMGHFPFAVIVNEKSMDEIYADGPAAAGELALVWGRKNPIALLEREGTRFVPLLGSSPDEFPLLSYLLQHTEDKEAFLKGLIKFNPEIDEKVMSAYRQIEMEGIIKGRQEGIQETAKRLIARGIDALTVSECTKMPIEEVQKLAASS